MRDPFRESRAEFLIRVQEEQDRKKREAIANTVEVVRSWGPGRFVFVGRSLGHMYEFKFVPVVEPKPRLYPRSVYMDIDLFWKGVTP